jgi:shikimate kinase
MIKFKSYVDVDLLEGINDPGIFKAVFLAGGPGSGKSFMVGKTALTALGLKLINSDPTFEAQLKKIGLQPTPEDIFTPKGQAARDKAKSLTKRRSANYIDGRLGLVVDGTGKDYNKIEKQAKGLKTLGYEVAMIFVNTNLKTAISRDAARKRTLGEKEVTKMWQEVQDNIGEFQSFFGNNMIIVDNSEGANWQKGSTDAYKKMSKWVSQPPSSGIAKKWIASVKSQRGISESVELEEARAKKAVAGSKVQKLVTGFDMSYKGKKYDEIDFELVSIDNSSKIVTFKILHPKEHIGNEVKIPFKSLRLGKFMATDTSKINKEGLEEDATAGLKAKAEKSGMPLGILKQVYNRGVAAWRTGHRPGTTPQQWGMARVNSFVTKSSGTWGKADKDLASKVRG